MTKIGMIVFTAFIALQFSATSFADHSNPGVNGGPPTKKCFTQDWQNISSFNGIVLRNADGDTVRVQYNPPGAKPFQISVRLLTIDTPETHYNGMDQGSWGVKASQHMATLLPLGAEVKVLLDVEKCDPNHRMLAYLFKDSSNINRKMIEDGFAVNYCIFPNATFCEDFANATQTAIDQKVGMYGAKDQPQVPYEWRREVSGRPLDRYIGNIRTKKVYKPTSMERVSLADRIFFSGPEQLPPGYSMGE